ncbi:hypothetical protein [Paenibacillus nasutitermitis]|uniref:Uncharacterized protein n=1 Tax=Paenibacillus nasutitermitis TaxID=1652958 RepID=A0A916YVY1_9BACL|nr:hypothetical protein [Paenibacillus nasutitermitis]GGD63550.1 hypothetical protein GCM10010911_21590 [Paenibacillus nasutitermitis]
MALNAVDHVHFKQLMEQSSMKEAADLGQQLVGGGFTAVRRFLDDFRAYLRKFTDEEGECAVKLLRYAKAALPEPGRISPSWVYIWKEFESIIQTKRQVFRDIAPARREGEWQVLLDNPHSNQNIAVYPALTFGEAVYMFAYFRTDLLNNEYLRLQKIDTLLTFTGSQRQEPLC